MRVALILSTLLSAFTINAQTINEVITSCTESAKQADFCIYLDDDNILKFSPVNIDIPYDGMDDLRILNWSQHNQTVVLADNRDKFYTVPFRCLSAFFCKYMFDYWYESAPECAETVQQIRKYKEFQFADAQLEKYPR